MIESRFRITIDAELSYTMKKADKEAITLAKFVERVYSKPWLMLSDGKTAIQVSQIKTIEKVV